MYQEPISSPFPVPRSLYLEQDQNDEVRKCIRNQLVPRSQFPVPCTLNKTRMTRLGNVSGTKYIKIEDFKI